MSYVTYPASSPYAKTMQNSFNLELIDWRSMPAATDDSLYTLGMQHQYRPDLLSYELYGTPGYWWVFCVRNPFLRADPIWNFVSGLQIIVPSVSTLNSRMGT